ncbi:hypothetical protein BJ878DRAFT_551036, partial [Calycina marina]
MSCQVSVMDKPTMLTKSSFTGPLLKVVVSNGANTEEFLVSKDLICTESAFFKSACNDNWKSGRTNTVTLADDDVTDFTIFLTWLHTRNLRQSTELNSLFGNFNTELFIRKLVDCYALGDVLLAERFQNCLMNSLIASIK